MAIAVIMPRWGMIMESGTIIAWLKEEGETVEKDEPLAEIESEKVVNELPAPATGVLRRIEVPADAEAEVGALLAVIAVPGDSDEEVQRVSQEHAQAARPRIPAGGGAAPAPAPAAAPRSIRTPSTPAARHLAHERGIDWAALSGTGPGGRIVLADVQLAASAAARPAGGGLPLSPVRRAIAERTLRSIQAPQAALCREMDLSDLMAARAELSLSLTACIVKLVALALMDAPQLNALFVDEVYARAEPSIGVVLPAPDGIAVPVIRGAAEITVGEIAAQLAELSDRAAAGELRRADVQDSTFTVSNAGPLGIDIFQPLLNPPEVAALGVGALRRRPWVVGDKIVPRMTAHFCVATDHRVVDAVPVGAFLDALEILLAHPAPHLT